MPILNNRNYYIQPTKEGVFIILIRAREDEAERPAVMYDGRTNALFLRRPKETIILDYINPTIQQKLVESTEVAIMELDFINEDVIRAYKVPMRRVDEIFVATHHTITSWV